MFIITSLVQVTKRVAMDFADNNDSEIVDFAQTTISCIIGNKEIFCERY